MKFLALAAFVALPNVALASPCSELLPAVYSHAEILEKLTVFTVTTFTENVRPYLQSCLDSGEHENEATFTTALRGALRSADATLAVGEEYKAMLAQFGGDAALDMYQKEGKNLAVGWLLSASEEEEFIRRLKVEFQGNFVSHMEVVDAFLQE